VAEAWNWITARTAKAPKRWLHANTVADTEPDKGPTLLDAIDKFEQSQKETTKDQTQAHYTRVFLALRKFMAARNVTYVKDLTPALCIEFAESGLVSLRGKKLKRSTLATYTAKWKAFLKWCEAKGLVEKRLAIRVEPVRFQHEQTMPLEPEELQKIIDASHTMYALLWRLMAVETGLRVSDALNFDPANCVRGDHGFIYRFRMVKRRIISRRQRVYCESFVSDNWMADLQAARSDWFSEELPFRRHGAAFAADYKATFKALSKIGASVGALKARPHRLRDTFAVGCFLRGMSLDDVSQLLHHQDIRMTADAYSAWIPARTRRLESVLAESRQEEAAAPQGPKVTVRREYTR
jgi:integrase